MTPLRQRMIEDMQVRNLAPHTQRAYLQQVSQFARHFRQVARAVGPSRYPRLPAPSRPGQAAFGQFDPGRGRRHPLPLQGHAEAGWNVDDVIPACRKPQNTSRRDEPGRGQPVPRRCREPQAPRHPDRLLRGWSADLRSGPPDACGDRQPTHGHPRRAGQRAEGPLRHALAQAARHPPRLLAQRGRSSGCSPAICPVNRSRPPPWRTPADRARTKPASPSRSRRTRCVTPLPSICWKPAPTCAPSSCCSGIAA